MVKRMRISRAGLLTLLGFLLAVSSYSSVEASTHASSQSSRRIPRQKIRGSERELKSGGSEENEGAPEKKNRIVPLPEFSRPIPNPEKFNKVGINLKVAKESTKPEPKLPEEKQAANIKVNKKNNSPRNPGKEKAAGLGKIVAKHNKEEVVQNGLEHFKEVEFETYRRELPSFSIKFNVDESLVSNTPGLADFNELTDVSEEYLDGFFASVFEDLAVVHYGTFLFLMPKEDDPFTVEFKLSLDFGIPGEVPTINYLIDRLQEAFERETSQSFYIADLSMMSETNPFSKTESFVVMSRPAVSAAEMDRTGGPPKSAGVESAGNSYVLVSVLAGMGCVVLIGVGIMWRKKTSQGENVSDSNEAFSLFDKSNKKDDSESNKIAGIYGADQDTMNYLNSIRKRYKDSGSSKASDSMSDDENIAVMGHSGSYEDTAEDDLRSIN